MFTSHLSCDLAIILVELILPTFGDLSVHAVVLSAGQFEDMTELFAVLHRLAPIDQRIQHHTPTRQENLRDATVPLQFELS